MSQQERKYLHIQSRTDTKEEWYNINPKLLEREIGYEKNTGQYKIGDGETLWRDLPYAHNIENGEGQFSLQQLSSQAKGAYSHSEGFKTQTGKDAQGAHSEGGETTAMGLYSHAEGYHTTASGNTSHAEGASTKASGTASHAEGIGTTASGENSHAEGRNNEAVGVNSHAEGSETTASGDDSHAEGYYTTASGEGSHAEGESTKSAGIYSHAEGSETTASGDYSHAEGSSTTASGHISHAEGAGTTASGENAHAEGAGTTASGENSHAEGNATKATNNCSHSEGGSTEATGDCAHAEGRHTIANGDAQHVQGRFNISDAKTTEYPKGKYAHIIGNGDNDLLRSNAHTIDWDGNAWFAGKVECEYPYSLSLLNSKTCRTPIYMGKTTGYISSIDDIHTYTICISDSTPISHAFDPAEHHIICTLQDSYITDKYEAIASAGINVLSTGELYIHDPSALVSAGITRLDFNIEVYYTGSGNMSQGGVK